MAVQVDDSACIACGVCEGICPSDAITIDSHAVIDPEQCIECGNCVAECPTKALEM